MSGALLGTAGALAVFAVFLIAFLVAPLALIVVFAVGLLAAERARRRG